jgi:BirA family biotin operon repressor/biotin-[acetyl-CoA-carboxylase] ligase
MTAEKDILNAEILQSKLNNNIEVIYYPSIDSTNSEAKRLLSEGKNNLLLVVSDEQTNGRGRQGKSFYSPAKTGIYMSFVFHPMADFSGVVSSTTAASVAVCRAIERLTDKRPEIKWVNDVYLNGKKICGILCEAINDPETGRIASVIIGIGLNITTDSFPDYVENAACLGENITRADMISEITKELIKILSCDYGDFIDYYRAHSTIIGKDIDFIQNGKATRAKALEIDNVGGLIVQLDGGEIKTLKSGEISIRWRN